MYSEKSLCMLRKYALTVVFLFVVCGAAAQLPDDEYYPYGTGYEQRTPIVLTDSSLSTGQSRACPPRRSAA